MLTIKIQNDGTGNETVGSYDYWVSVDGREIALGHVDARRDGWQELVRAVARSRPLMEAS